MEREQKEARKSSWDEVRMRSADREKRRTSVKALQHSARGTRRIGHTQITTMFENQEKYYSQFSY